MFEYPALAVKQTENMVTFRKEAAKEMQRRFYGMMQTVWLDTPHSSRVSMEIKKTTKVAIIRHGIASELCMIS